jgi:hypothetical protein
MSSDFVKAVGKRVAVCLVSSLILGPVLGPMATVISDMDLPE